MVFLFKIEESDDLYQISALDLTTVDWEVYRHVARTHESTMAGSASRFAGITSELEYCRHFILPHLGRL
jgi:hypothetical protein